MHDQDNKFNISIVLLKPQINWEPGAVLYSSSTNLAPGVLDFTYLIARLGACFLVKKGEVAPGPCFLKSRLGSYSVSHLIYSVK